MMKNKYEYKELDSKIKIKSDSAFAFSSLKKPLIGDADEKKIIALLCIVLIIVLFGSVFLTVDLAAYDFSFATYFQTVTASFKNFYRLIFGLKNYGGIDMTAYRILIVGLVGAALSVSGAVYQGIFRNPMASPGIIGAQSGGVLAGAAYIFFFTAKSTTAATYNYGELMDYYSGMSLFEKYSRQILVLAGSFTAVLIIVFIAKTAGRGKISTVALLLAGSVFSSFIQSCISILRYYMIKLDPTDSRISEMQLFMLGSFNDAFTHEHLFMIGIPVVICLTLLTFIRRKINVLVFGEDEAKLMGINVGALRFILISAATVLTAITVSFCGQIGFIGLMVPHIARFITGPDYKTLIPVSALLGAVILILIYDLAFTLNLAVYVNLFSSFIGGPLFMILMIKSRRDRNAEWA